MAPIYCDHGTYGFTPPNVSLRHSGDQEEKAFVCNDIAAIASRTLQRERVRASRMRESLRSSDPSGLTPDFVLHSRSTLDPQGRMSVEIPRITLRSLS
jgi:hypothetical protein